MKTFKTTFLVILLCSVSAFAQFGNSYGGGYRNNGMSNVGDSKPSAGKSEKERSEQIDKVVARLKEDLNLDELQVIAIKNEFISSNKNVDILMKSEISDEDKGKQYAAIQEKAEKNILSYLNAAQKEKYQLLKLEKKDKKEDKKRKTRGRAEQSEAKDKDKEKAED